MGFIIDDYSDDALVTTIARVFLPHNPNKMRKPHPNVLAAVREFKAIASRAETAAELAMSTRDK